MWRTVPISRQCSVPPLSHLSGVVRQCWDCSDHSHCPVSVTLDTVHSFILTFSPSAGSDLSKIIVNFKSSDFCELIHKPSKTSYKIFYCFREKRNEGGKKSNPINSAWHCMSGSKTNFNCLFQHCGEPSSLPVDLM